MVLKIPKRLIWENLSTLLCYPNFLNWIYIYNKKNMVREFKFFRGYVDKTITEQWVELLREYPATPGTGIINWGGTTANPTWVTNPNWYTPNPYTITTTPGSGTITLPYMYGTNTTSTLTTSNPNGITYTTGGFGGTLTTGTATYSSSSFKLQSNEI